MVLADNLNSHWLVHKLLEILNMLYFCVFVWVYIYSVVESKFESQNSCGFSDHTLFICFKAIKQSGDISPNKDN